MKKCMFVIVLILLFLSTTLAMSACSVSFPVKSPNDGIFYCEELKIGIDFSLLQVTIENTRLYFNDGSYMLCRTMRDYGNGIGIYSLDQHTEYFGGNFKYKNDVLYVPGVVNVWIFV